jgi:hypothetical protein
MQFVPPKIRNFRSLRGSETKTATVTRKISVISHQNLVSSCRRYKVPATESLLAGLTAAAAARNEILKIKKPISFSGMK